VKIVADESVDFGIVKLLRNLACEVISIAELHSGIDDKAVLEKATENKCLLVTEDKDFGELTHRLKLQHFGILLIRLSELKRNERIELAASTILKHYKELQGNFAVITPHQIRIKKL